MNKNFNLMMFKTVLIMGVVISMSSNNWMSMWLGMEISMMSFIPLMSSKKKLSSESCMKYYIIQSLSSSIMMMGIIMISLNLNFNMILILSIFMKLGMTPFHNWVLSIVEGMNYSNMFILFTFMKMAPMNMMSYINVEIQLIVMLGLIISSVSAINQNSIKKIMSYSSIYNMSMMMTSISNWTSWLTYMTMYLVANFMMMKMCEMMNLNFINQIYMNNYNLMNKIMMWIFMTSISGMPPMITFMMKMIIMEEMITTNQYMMLYIIISTSVITMFFYMRMSLLSLMFFLILPKWMMTKKKKIKNEYLLISVMIYPITCCLKSFY
uniref:NADH-ubiquinone oxidoreductase chain 2 n=1 Tax=Entylia carinata TaxID=1464891 RepID=A0A343AXP0_ENTCR|nr:NADH dehydrogenase subunit 2 [Entylia carinata]APU51888.1 NADH dehydrogenase subunit 2 [Entylia carinata]